jgi:hypothetical protein
MWVEKRGKLFVDEEEFEMEVQKWLRQQSKDFCAVGFDARGRRCEKFINVGGGYVEIQMFLGFECHMSRFTSICDLFADSPSYLVFFVEEAICRS